MTHLASNSTSRRLAATGVATCAAAALLNALRALPPLPGGRV